MKTCIGLNLSGSRHIGKKYKIIRHYRRFAFYIFSSHKPAMNELPNIHHTQSLYGKIIT